MATKKRKTASSTATTAKKKKKGGAKSSTTSTTAKKKKGGSKTKSTTSSAAKKISKALTRSQQIAYVAEQTELNKKDVAAVVDSFESLIASHLRGPGQISFAGLMKVIAVRKPATKARKGVNPFTGEPTTFKAKPARNVVRIRALKKVKDFVA